MPLNHCHLPRCDCCHESVHPCLIDFCACWHNNAKCAFASCQASVRVLIHELKWAGQAHTRFRNGWWFRRLLDSFNDSVSPPFLSGDPHKSSCSCVDTPHRCRCDDFSFTLQRIHHDFSCLLHICNLYFLCDIESTWTLPTGSQQIGNVRVLWAMCLLQACDYTSIFPLDLDWTSSELNGLLHIVE